MNVWLALSLDVGEPDLRGPNLLKGWAPHLISEGKPSHLMEETHFCPLHFQSHSVCTHSLWPWVRVGEKEPNNKLSDFLLHSVLFSPKEAGVVSTSLQTPTCPSLSPHLWSRSWDTWTPPHTETTHSNPRWELHPLWTKKRGWWPHIFLLFLKFCLNRSAQHGQPAVWTKPVCVN